MRIKKHRVATELTIFTCNVSVSIQLEGLNINVNANIFKVSWS